MTLSSLRYFSLRVLFMELFVVVWSANKSMGRIIVRCRVSSNSKCVWSFLTFFRWATMVVGLWVGKFLLLWWFLQSPVRLNGFHMLQTTPVAHSWISWWVIAALTEINRSNFGQSPTPPSSLTRGRVSQMRWSVGKRHLHVSRSPTSHMSSVGKTLKRSMIYRKPLTMKRLFQHQKCCFLLEKYK